MAVASRTQRAARAVEFGLLVYPAVRLLLGGGILNLGLIGSLLCTVLAASPFLAIPDAEYVHLPILCLVLSLQGSGHGAGVSWLPVVASMPAVAAAQLIRPGHTGLPSTARHRRWEYARLAALAPVCHSAVLLRGPPAARSQAGVELGEAAVFCALVLVAAPCFMAALPGTLSWAMKGMVTQLAALSLHATLLLTAQRWLATGTPTWSFHTFTAQQSTTSSSCENPRAAHDSSCPHLPLSASSSAFAPRVTRALVARQGGGEVQAASAAALLITGWAFLAACALLRLCLGARPVPPPAPPRTGPAASSGADAGLGPPGAAPAQEARGGDAGHAQLGPASQAGGRQPRRGPEKGWGSAAQAQAGGLLAAAVALVSLAALADLAAWVLQVFLTGELLRSHTPAAGCVGSAPQLHADSAGLPAGDALTVRAGAAATSGALAPRYALLLKALAPWLARALPPAWPAAAAAALQQQPVAAGRLLVLAYWALVLQASLAAQHVIAGPHRALGAGGVGGGGRGGLPLAVVRKGYHVMALLLFVPVLWLDPAMLMVSLAVAFAVLLAVEVVRATQLVPPVSRAIEGFMGRFVDERDAGGLYLTHLALLLGLAGPTWLAAHTFTLAAPHLPQPHAVPHTNTGRPPVLALQGMGGDSAAAGMACWWLLASAGMVGLGVGDTAAAVWGRLLGRHRLHAGTSRTWEGMAAGAVSMVLVTCCILAHTGAWAALGASKCAEVLVHVVGAAVLEAVTGQLDNLVLPVWLCTCWLLVLRA